MIEFRKEYFADERDDDLVVIGQPVQRQDMLGHVTGRSPYYDDHLFEGMLHIKCVRSPHHHARIRRIDTSAAERSPGVVRILRAADVPRNYNTLLSLLDFGRDDEPTLADGKVRYRGEPVVAIVAESERAAHEAVAKVRVDYEVLPHVLDVEEALRPDAPVVNDVYPDNCFEYHDRYDHQKLRFGDVERALREADLVVEGRYQMSPIEHAPVEPAGAIAVPETNDRIACYTCTQALFFSLGTAARILDVPSNRLHFVGGTVGGGFGGKVDTLHEPLAILACMLTGRPVRYRFDRPEEMQVGPPRGAERWYITDGVMRDGRIVARKFIGYFDAGAYTRLSSYAVIKAAAHLPGPYTIPNVYADVYCVYTNRTPSSAMRGFGITGVDFAIESHMDRVAHEIGMDPVELRILNAYRDGDMKAHRRIAKNCALIECAQVAAEKAGWPIREEFRRMSSREGGGGDRAVVPPTVTDDNGRIGERRRRRPERAAPSYRPPEPAQTAAPSPVPEPRQALATTPPAAAPAPPPPPVPERRPAEPPPQPAAPPPSRPAPRTPGRFSSIFGTRRR